MSRCPTSGREEMKSFQRSILHALIAAVLVLVTTNFGQAQQQSTATPTPLPSPAQLATNPFPPAQYIRPHNYDQRNIKLDLRFDWEKEQAIGTATITFAPTLKDVRIVEFDAGSMTVGNVRLAAGTALKYEYDEKKEKLAVSLDRAYQPTDEVTIVVSYHTNRPPIAGIGLNFLKPGPDDPGRPQQIWSNGEPESNHFWFPCFDHPNDFVTTEIVATVKKPFIVISNGALISTKENSDGTRTFDWKMDVPHATYLTSVVIGDYVPITGKYAGIPVTTNVYRDQVQEGRVCGETAGNGEVLLRKNRGEVSVPKIRTNDCT